MSEVYFQEAGSGDPVTVLLHSSTADGRMWDPLWPALTARSRVIRLDFRGYGRTPYASPVPYGDCGDVAALLTRLGLTRVLLVGASYGGQVALEVATAHPELVGGLVLLDAGCGLPKTPDLRAFIISGSAPGTWPRCCRGRGWWSWSGPVTCRAWSGRSRSPT
ncbi:alpha/beta fold hydrolase [Spongiactinospora gelatinilytica]|uniref:alpha/beta fold hydrolase n=1 Tax=Spongiactinospora gelatinilytica TaxID=2666298 RepID=UPI0018F6D9E4|nr:alpha/beta hydrolase [Spongiactinospora gelatinilytica]